jgi:hypothetical protein
MLDRFGKTDVTVTLTGEEWFALLARIAKRPLSPEGARIYKVAVGKLQQEILAESDRVKNLEKGKSQ